LKPKNNTQQQIYDAKYDECLKLEKKLIETEIERENARKQTSDKEQELNDKQNEFDSLMKEYKDFEHKIKTELKQTKKTLQTRENEIDRLTGVVSDRDQEIRKNKTKIQTLEKNIKDLNNELENRDGVIAEKDYDIEERDNKIDGLEQKIKDNQKHYDNKYQTQKDHYEDILGNERKDRQNTEDNLRGQIKVLESQIVDMVNDKNAILGNHEDVTNQLNERINELLYSIDDLQNSLKGEKDHTANLERNIVDINQKHSDE
jgi:chromosome segregation ATPase